MDIQLLQSIAVAAGLGFFGQTLRAGVGLMKQADASIAAGKTAFEGVSFTRLALTLALGSLAGETAWLGLHYLAAPEASDLAAGGPLVAVITAGYAGADFIEAFGRRYMGAK